jgi:hypothetical protein
MSANASTLDVRRITLQKVGDRAHVVISAHCPASTTIFRKTAPKSINTETSRYTVAQRCDHFDVLRQKQAKVSSGTVIGSFWRSKQRFA